MLRGISPILTPELLSALSAMGHGDEITLADAHYPRFGDGQRTIRMDGLGIPTLLEAIMPLFKLDQYEDKQYLLMAPVAGDSEAPVWDSYRKIISAHDPGAEPEFLERFRFYERAQSSYLTVVTGETAQYGNIILRKGVILD